MGDFGLKEGPFVESVVPTDRLAVFKNFLGTSVLLGGDVAEFLKKRQVDVGLDIALSTRVPVPIPGTSEIAALFNNADITDTCVAKASSSLETSEPSADNEYVDLIGDRAALGLMVDVRVIKIVSKLANHL
jgi:hypothetical protein